MANTSCTTSAANETGADLKCEGFRQSTNTEAAVPVATEHSLAS